MGQKKGFFIILISMLILLILAGVFYLAWLNTRQNALSASPSPQSTQPLGRSSFCVPIPSPLPSLITHPAGTSSPAQSQTPQDLDPNASPDAKAKLLVLRCDGRQDLILFDPLTRSPLNILSPDDLILAYEPPMAFLATPSAAPSAAPTLAPPATPLPTSPAAPSDPNTPATPTSFPTQNGAYPAQP